MEPLLKPVHDEEAQRILREYGRRSSEVGSQFYALDRPANLFFHQSRQWEIARVIRLYDLAPLSERKILEVGCGHGKVLCTIEEFDAERKNLAGIDLDPARARACAQRFPQADIRQGDATQLPWPDATFDIVMQNTVFTSILDSAMKRSVASEMLRVLKPQGVILWYDFLFNNPRNPNVRGVGKAEIKQLFPDCRIQLRRITLAPPLARRIVPISWLTATLLERLRVLNTHYFGVIRRNG